MASISGNEDLRDLFAIFHDGSLSLQSADKDHLDLIVDIGYLAERIKPGYRLFHVQLKGASELTFNPWLAETDPGPRVVSDIQAIFEQDLEILYTRIEGSMLAISCNANADDIDYSGGELLLRAESAHVTDEAGTGCGLDQLKQICGGYWRDWKQNHEARRRAKDQASKEPPE